MAKSIPAPSAAASAVPDDDAIHRLLELQPLDGGRYRAAGTAVSGRPVVFGGQLMAQTLMVAAKAGEGKQVRQLHTVFARAGAAGQPVDYDVEAIHAGRTLGSLTVTARQDARIVCRSLVLLDAGEPDLFRQAEPMPPVSGPDELPDAAWAEAGARIRLADAVDLDERAPNGPAELGVWVRWPSLGSPSPAVHWATASWYTDPFLIAASLRPHNGFGQSMAHKSLSTSVVSHTLTLHDQLRADDWHLVWQRVLFAGAGRVHGRGELFTAGGRHVGSFVQEAVVRRLRTPSGGAS